MTIRKNFIFDDETAHHLEEIAKKAKTTQTQVVKDMIEEKYQDVSVEEKLAALKRIAGSSTGLFTNKSIQSIKANMDV